MPKAYYIKLGMAGDRESDCLKDGTLWLDYHQTSSQALGGDWQAVRNFWNEFRTDKGAATRDVNQIRVFFEADESAIFITFANGLLHWCHPKGPVSLQPDKTHLRETVNGWHSTSQGGTPLTTDRLSGNLLKLQMFRGTICEVEALDYLLHKLNDKVLPEVSAAEKAEDELLKANICLMRRLTWQDFELLVDLAFSASGWRRIGVVGKTQKTVDIELVLPTTGERAFVQVKSVANNASLAEYKAKFGNMPIYGRMFFVWHSGEVMDDGSSPNLTLIGPESLSRLVLDAGLSSWLREKIC